MSLVFLFWGEVGKFCSPRVVLREWVRSPKFESRRGKLLRDGCACAARVKLGMRNVRRVHLTDIWSWYRVDLRVGDHLGRSEELVSRCVECDLAEPESLASLGGSAPGVFDGILSGLDPFLSTVDDKVPILRVLAHRIRDGRASRSGRPVRAERVRDEILAVAKVFTSVGLQDPRFTTLGHMDPRLTTLYASYSNADPAPTRVKPLPIQVLQAIVQPSPLGRATIDMAWLAFFFLLRPGEYCAAPDNHPLRFANVTLLIGATRLDLLTASPADLRHATHVSLTFDDQKNRERGEVIAHGRSGHVVACPVLTTICRVLFLRAQHLPLTSPLCTYVHSRPTPLTSNHITSLLCEAARSLLTVGFAPTDVNARSLRAGGAMALLCGRVDADTIRLVGRWRSDAMFRYLHAQALPLIRDLSRLMLHHGAYTLLPGTDLPQPAAELVAAA